MAIVCGLNAAEAWKIYQYGPDHPLSKKILKHKIRDSSLKKLKKKEQEKMMKAGFVSVKATVCLQVNEQMGLLLFFFQEWHKNFQRFLKTVFTLYL